MTSDIQTRAVWRKSSFSAGNGGTDDCVEVAVLNDDRAALRDSKHPNRGPLLLPRAQMAAFITGIKHNQFDSLTT